MRTLNPGHHGQARNEHNFFGVFRPEVGEYNSFLPPKNDRTVSAISILVMFPSKGYLLA